MKSLFSENDIVLPEWLGILLEKVDRDTVQELLADHEEYRTFCAKRKELLNQYPVIETLLEDSGEVSISEQEHQAALEYFQVRDKIENKERWLRIVWKMKNVCIIICMDISIAMNI
mgnify:CR=1 FL=1